MLASNAAASKFTTFASDASNLPSKLTAAQTNNFSLQFSVKATANSSTATIIGWNNLAVTESKNTTTAGNAKFGNTAVTIQASKITDGMKITIGTGTGAVRYIKLAGSNSKVPASVAASKVIDLSKLATKASSSGATTYTIAASKAADIAAAIANSYRTPENNGGVVVGAAGSKVTLSEYVNGGNRESAASSNVKEAMKTVDGFKTLVKFESANRTEAAASSAVKTITVDTNKLFSGNTLTLTDKDGNERKFEFTADTLATGANMVVMGSGLADRLKNAIGSASGVTVTASNGVVTISYAVGSATASTCKADASVSANRGLKLQIGDTADTFNQLKVEIADMHTDALGIDAANMRIDNQDDAAQAVDMIKRAINQVSDLRGTLGATQNRLDHTINNLSVMTENIQDAESTIRDTDVAEEMMAYTKNNILIQSAQAMLAQANQVPQGVLQLLQ